SDPCLVVMPPCMGEADRFSLEALRHIHKQLDDDNDGGIEVNESVEFIIEDMKQQQTNKHSNLHREDQHITVEELWRGWKTSEGGAHTQQSSQTMRTRPLTLCLVLSLHPVHNWTMEDTVQWLKDSVELPQYEKNFRDFRVTGNTLPRIAANEPSFMSTQLKILDQRHKQKLNLKALDAVLFGPPLRESAACFVQSGRLWGPRLKLPSSPDAAGPQHNWMKDFVLMVSIVIGVGGCWFAYVQNKSSKVHISQMMKDLDSLPRHAEQSTAGPAGPRLTLRLFSSRLEKAQEENRTVAVEKQNLEQKMKDEITDAKLEAHRLRELREGAECELSRLKYAEEELVQVSPAGLAFHGASQPTAGCGAGTEGPEAGGEADAVGALGAGGPPEVAAAHPRGGGAVLQHQEAERRVPAVRGQGGGNRGNPETQQPAAGPKFPPQPVSSSPNQAEKIKKKRSSVFGTLHVAHSSSLDEVDHKILEAKKALSEVTACLRERLHRWQQIEKLCSFPIVSNQGLSSLTATLYSDHSWVVMPRVGVPPYPIAGGVDDLDEDTPPIIPQFTSTSLLRPPLTRSSSLCRSRRSLLSSPQPSLVSADPDLLSVAGSSLSYRPEAEGEHALFGAERRGETPEGCSDCDSLGSSLVRKQLHGAFVLGSDAPYRKISREELLLFGQSGEGGACGAATRAAASSSNSSSSRDSTPPPLPAPSASPSPSLEHHPLAHTGSPDLTRAIPESQSMTFSRGGVASPPGKGAYNGVLEKSYSFGQLPVSMLPKVGRNPSLTSLDSEGRSLGKERKLQSASSQDSSDNGEKAKRSSSKLKSLFKKK
ncbi:unnamed protein product, partial [Tetraodon nigroviridis]